MKSSKKNSIRKEIKVPYILQNELDNNSRAKENFNNVVFTYRKQYTLHFSSTKRETTILNSLVKVITNIERNKRYMDSIRAKKTPKT